jgi:hypothetical protein
MIAIFISSKLPGKLLQMMQVAVFSLSVEGFTSMGIHTGKVISPRFLDKYHL